MRRVLFSLLTFALLAAGFRLLSACLTIEPVIVEHPDARTSGGCLAGVELPEKCAGIIEQCQAADPRCKPAFSCIEREACFDLLTLDDKILCGLPCAQDAGIQSADDPVISTYLVGLVGCAQEKCAVPCNLSDASV